MTAVETVPAVDVYISRQELAKRLGLTPNVLAHWPARGYGPKARKFGGRIRYKMSDVLAWEDADDQDAGGAA